MEQQLPPQLQNQLLQLRQLQQQFQAVALQKSQVESMLRELKSALEELSKAGEDAVIYKDLGVLLLRVTKQQAEQDLRQRNENYELRLKILERQEERINRRIQELQQQIQQQLAQHSISAS